jgi:hypothetical protein
MTYATYKCTNASRALETSRRMADRRRGWAKFCSKSCKATEQTRRTGRGAPTPRDLDAESHEAGMDAVEFGWDGHKNVF